jgi:hypothetical protein
LGYILGYFSQTHASFRFKTVEKGWMSESA